MQNNLIKCYICELPGPELQVCPECKGQVCKKCKSKAQSCDVCERVITHYSMSSKQCQQLIEMNSEQVRQTEEVIQELRAQIQQLQESMGLNDSTDKQSSLIQLHLLECEVLELQKQLDQLNQNVNQLQSKQIELITCHSQLAIEVQKTQAEITLITDTTELKRQQLNQVTQKAKQSMIYSEHYQSKIFQQPQPNKKEIKHQVDDSGGKCTNQDCRIF